MIKEQDVGLSTLTFNPVVTTTGRGVVKQQFGLSPYEFPALREQLDILITFEEPFENEFYAITATSDHPACYAVIRSKTASNAVVGLIRTRLSDDPHGSINWIAIGN
ncbi:WIAG-tail domain [Paenibacillus sp. NEAU-GSW1]|uniref:WIAG-tail domain n=1 Tax=Paenibacillus sp. NEAU-GSW1 TaxID=2682486 RepID=UPI00346423EC